MKSNNYRIVQFAKSGIDKQKHNSFVNSFEECTFYHSYEYYNALKSSSFVDEIALYCLNLDNEIVGLLIGEKSNEIKKLPYLTKRSIFYSTPLYDNQIILETLLFSLKKMKTGLFIQFRPFHVITQDDLMVYNSFNYVKESHLSAFIKITTEEMLWKGLAKDKRKGIRKAKEIHNLIIKSVDNDVEEFYRIQKILFNSKRHSLKGKTYFENLINNTSGKVKIIFAEYNGKLIATQLYSEYNSVISAIYTSTLPEYRDKYAGDLLIWHLLMEGIKRGYKIFDFGGGGNPNQVYSPRDYKKRFGTIFEDVGRLTLPTSVLYGIIMYTYRKVLKS